MTIGRARLFDVLAAMPFPEGRWVVAGSGPLLAMGVIDAISDIDIVADAQLWRSVSRMAGVSQGPALLGDRRLTLEVDGVGVEVFDGWLGIDAESIIEEGVAVDGYLFSPLERVAESKRSLGRPKDRIHLRQIERFSSE